MGSKGFTERAAERRLAEITRPTEATSSRWPAAKTAKIGLLSRVASFFGCALMVAMFPLGRRSRAARRLLDVLGSQLIQVSFDQNDLIDEYLFSPFAENIGNRRIRITFFRRHEL